MWSRLRILESRKICLLLIVSGLFMNARINGLLADLPEAELEFFAPHLKLVSLTKGQTLFSQGDKPSHVYYPVGAIVSLMIDNQAGDSTESFMLGKSCMVGAATLGEPSFYRAQVRHSGLAYQLPVSVLLQAREHCPAYFRNAIHACGFGFIAVILIIDFRKSNLIRNENK